MTPSAAGSARVRGETVGTSVHPGPSCLGSARSHFHDSRLIDYCAGLRHLGSRHLPRTPCPSQWLQRPPDHLGIIARTAALLLSLVLCLLRISMHECNVFWNIPADLQDALTCWRQAGLLRKSYWFGIKTKQESKSFRGLSSTEARRRGAEQMRPSGWAG